MEPRGSLEMGEMGSEKTTREGKLQKSYIDVLGLCCSSEVPLIEKILQPLDGIHKVSVIVASKTVIVVHDTTLISQLQIVKALNRARLEATIRAYGTDKIAKKWPSPYILACGLLLLGSLFKRFFLPLQWLALAAVVVGLPPIVMRSIAALRRYTLDINILMLIAVGGAVALRDYSEAGFIVFLFTIAEWLESRASHKAKAGMSSLMSMAPQKAVVAETGEVVDVQDVKVNAVLAVKAGEVIPIDGVVVEGRSEVDESSLTGESYPVAKQAESVVWAGTLNLDGYISVRTTALAEHSAVAKMARLVEESQNSRSSTQRLIDSCAKYYTPAVVVIAAGVAVIPLILRVHSPKHWFQLALVLLVSACPCALVLSTPVATFCALLKAAKTGLLVKGGDVLEALAKTRVVALDKTGTITMGEFTVVEFRPISCDVTLDELVYWVSSVECKSSHPMASALVDYARSKSIDPKPENVSEFRIYPGEGIYGEVDGKSIYVGNRRIASRAGCETVPNVESMKEAVTQGYVFWGPTPVGIFTLSDTCRTGAAEAIRELKSLGVKTAMLTGDSTEAAMHAQNQLGNAIEMLHAELLPEDKVRIISDLKARVGSTTMVGDGLNDAPALAMSSVGISMGVSGSAIAMETGHITLMSNDIRKIPKAIRLARRTHRKIITNISFSLIAKIAILALAVAGHPLLWAAVLADVGTCLIVILNSMLLLRTRTAAEGRRCCGSSHKSHAHKHASEERCSGGACVSSGACQQSNGGNGAPAHSCHDHEAAGEGRASKLSCHDHGRAHNCSSARKTDSPTHTHCDPHHVANATNAGSEHSILIAGEAEDHSDSPNHSHCDPGPVTRPTNASHKHSISLATGAEDHRGRSQACCHNRDIARDCHSGATTEKIERGGCCGSERERARGDGCSSSRAHIGKREIGGCGRSCAAECAKNSGCRGGGMVRLAEIITE